MRTLLICHEGVALDQEGLARWLASFSTLVGMILIHEKPARVWRRARRELRRVGPLRFLDVLAFRVYDRVFLARRYRRWLDEQLATLRSRYPDIPPETPVLHTSDPNTSDARTFVSQRSPDVMLARCKTLLREDVFTIPSAGTFALHPGICPEYRNAYGCFWALARGDLERVGLTLLRIDRGVDTGPVFGYYSSPFDARREAHAVIQDRMLLENLERIKRTLIDLHEGRAKPLDTSGRASATWGQPWLSAYLRWKRRMRQDVE
jgi:hypothetical protein